MLVLPTEQVADQINQREEQMRREADTKITIHRGRHAGMETVSANSRRETDRL
jgi:hypothetical protein